MKGEKNGNIHCDNQRKSGIEVEEEDIKAGRVYTATSAADLFRNLLKIAP